MSQREYWLAVFGVPEESIESESNPLLWSNLRTKRIKGLILTSRLPAKDIVLLQEQRIPFIWLDNDFPFERIHSIIVDNSFTISLALNHLSAHGYKRVALIHFWWEPFILSLFQNKLAENGMETNPELIKTGEVVTDEEERELAYKKTKELLKMDPKPEAIITPDEVITYSAIEAIEEEGLQIPGDIAIIGGCHTPKPFYLPKTTSFILYPTEEMAKLAVSMLKNLIIEKTIEQPKLILKPSLIIRNSCGCSGKERVVYNPEEAKRVS